MISPAVSAIIVLSAGGGRVLPTGMPASLVLTAFGVYVMFKYSFSLGAIVTLVGLVLIYLIWTHRARSPK